METNDQAIATRLSELDALETVSGFSRTFYRLTARLVTLSDDQHGVRVALAGLLDVELRYHRELRVLSERAAVGFADLQGAGERHRIGLRAVQQYGEQLEGGDTPAQASRDLVLAECAYHLRRTGEVVEALERVVRQGLNQPLIQFALGYNRYLLALETCTQATESGDELLVQDVASFRVQCLRAVGALEEGLQGTELDGQLYWWMGVILEAAGLTEAAQDAYDKSANLLQPPSPDGTAAADEGWSERQDGTVPQAISDEEVWQVGRALQGPFDPAALFGREQDER
jgi:tetratricopeptide (TPR) repeat protein